MMAPSGRDRDGRSGDPDLRRGAGDVDEQLARAPHVLALEDPDARRALYRAERAQVGAERGGGRTGRGVLDDAANGERVARVEHAGALAPDQVDGREVAL